MGIKQPIKDILTQLGTLQVMNQDAKMTALFARVFNDQFKKLEKGAIQAFQLPAAFLQIVSPFNVLRIGSGRDAGDIIFRVHVGHEQMDAGDGTMEQDLAIFDTRDAVIKLLSDFQPSGCSPLMHTADTPNNEHTNLYVYEIDFTTHFIDTSAVKDDTINKTIGDIIVNAEADLSIQENISVTVNQARTNYQIPQK